MPFIGAAIVGIIGLAGFAATATAFVINVGLAVGLSVVSQSISQRAAKKARRKAALAAAATAQGPRGTELQLSTEANHPRTLILGERGVAGSLVYWCMSGTNSENLDLVIDLADHEIDGVSGIFVDGKLSSWVPDSSGYGLLTEFQAEGMQHCSVRVYKGTEGQIVDPIVSGSSAGQWTAAHRLRGVAYAHVRLVWHQEAFRGGGIPNFLFRVRGAKLYDPRKDSTQPGGSGAHRWGQPHTYEYTNNLEICRYNYLRGINWVNGRPMFGVGLPPEDLDFDRTVAAMGICEQLVARLDGLSESRYGVACVIEANEEHNEVLAKFSTACAGSLPDLSGRYALQPGVAQIPVISFSDDDIIAGAELSGSRYRSISEVVNETTGNWADPSALYQRTPLPARRSSADEISDGGFRRSAEYDLEYCISQTQGQRVLEIFRRLARRQRTHRVTLRRRYAILEAGDWIVWNSDLFGYVGQTFRVEQVTLNEGWQVTVDLTEIDSGIYGWSLDDELDPADPRDLPSGGPPMTGVSGFAIATAQVNSLDGTQLPAIRATWSPIADPTVVGLRIDYRRVGDTPWFTYHVPIDQVRAGAATITSGIVAGSIYEARATLITSPPRVTQVSPTVAAAGNTPSIIVNVAKVSEVTESVKPGIISRDALDGPFREAFDEALYDNLDRLIISNLGQAAKLAAAEEQINRATARIRADVALGLNPIGAGIERLDQAIAEVTAAFAAADVAINAQIAGVAADLATEQSTRASADGALAQDMLDLTAQVGTDIAGVQQQVTAQAANNALTASDVTRLFVQDTEIGDAATLAALIEAGKRGEVDEELKRRTSLAFAGIESNRVATLSNGEAIAAVGDRLTVEVDDRQAQATTETQARINADGAISSQTTVLFAQDIEIADANALGAMMEAGNRSAANEQSQRAANIATAKAELVNIANVANGEAIAATLTKLTAEIADRKASVSAEEQARVDDVSALASSITTINAKTEAISANGQVGIVAMAGEDGAAASFRVNLMAGSTRTAFRMDAMSDGTSRVVFDANEFLIQHPSVGGGLPQAMFQANGSGGLVLNGNTRINGNLFVEGSIEATKVKAGFSAIGSTAGTAYLSGGTSSGWTNLGPPLTLTVPPRGGYAFPLIILRDAAAVQNSTGINQSGAAAIRLLINGNEVYYHELFNTVLPPNLGASAGLTDFLDAAIFGTSHTFQLQYQHNVNPGFSGTIFAKVMAQMIAR